MYEVFENLLKERGITIYKFCKDTKISESTIYTWKKKGSTVSGETAKKIAAYFGVTVDFLMTGEENKAEKNTGLNARDEKDIAKDLAAMREKLLNKEDGPASFDGENVSEESAELLLTQIEAMLRTIKVINKEKYNPNKNKK